MFKKKRFGKCSGNYRLEDIWADADEISGAIRKMEKNYPTLSRKIFIITEGPYDYEFYSRFFSGDLCEIRIANSKKNVISVVNSILSEISGNASDSVIGIIDRDFSFFEDSEETNITNEDGEGSRPENLFLTDTHDIETMIVSNDLIKRVLDHYATNSAGKSFQRSMLDAVRGGDILSKLVECCSFIGFSLYINEKYNLNITFKHINCKKRNVFTDFTDVTSMSFDKEKYLVLLKKRNKEKYDRFLEALSREKPCFERFLKDPMQLCRGHDLMCVLLADININYPQKSGEKVRSRDLERLFRNMYDENRFYETGLFKDLKRWAENKIPKISDEIFLNSTGNAQ
ncbi:hypothetical protein J2128_002091 [Methanomicrobium sp. W14]|uniref:DUF4435 domain-containing protein n=1 Tax=Methanomicrobium sp. W14 TaxID=2817839 RepID=UPI001AEB0600|nr:DUF4435 domain-containing protein [Methanomicrobium sp. W14]MBP2134125.1 hypothetical protein [Methanomicrobium sp. W14]